MTLEQIQDLKKRHDNAVAAMKDAASALNVEGLTDSRKSELEATFARAERDQEEAYQNFQRSQKAFEAEKRNAELFYENEEKRGRANDKRDPKEVSEDFNAVFRKYMIQGEARMTEAERSLLEKRGTNSLVAGTNSLGGFTVPVSLANQIIETMKAYGGVLEVANILLTDSGNPLNFPTNDDTSAKAVLVAESGTATVQDTTFAQVAVGAYMYRDLIKLSTALIQDSAFDIEAYVAKLMGTRFGRAANESCTTGTGSSQPQGVVTGSTLGKTAASATAITFAEIIDLVHSVDPEYRRNGRFMMHDNVLAYIKKLSIGASDARPLWQPSFIVGEPATIDGYRYVINQDMDSTINTASKLILFGDFSKYLVRQSKSLEILRNQYSYMADAAIGLFGFARWDAKLLDTAAVKHLITA